MITVVLVHGTFASNAEWLDAGSAIRASLATALHGVDEIRFRKIVWSGKNQLEERRRASEKIARLIRRSKKNEKFILLGHSHGGSAIAYYLKSKETIDPKILGCAFLSTPFVALRERTGGLALNIAALLVLNFAWQSLVWPELGIPGFSAAILSSLIVSSLVSWPMYALYRINGNKLNRLIERSQTAGIPKGNYLFLRTSGDEAAAALSFAQFVTWLSTKVSRFAMRRIVDGREAQKSFAGIRPVVMVGLIVAFPIVASGYRHYRGWLPDLVPAYGQLLIKAMNLEVGAFSVISLFGIFVATLVVLYFLFFAVVIVIFLSMLVQALMARAFGWSGFLESLLVDMAVEPVPFGSYRLHHIQWHPSANDSDYTHSWTYQNEEALGRIEHWVRSTVGRK